MAAWCTVQMTSLLVLTAHARLDWWQKTVLYQVYPRSFQDSNGDGTGDINGITARLTHLKDLGVEAIWLSPIFTSPMVDFGYDIADFKSVDPLFGTMDDFHMLTVKAKELGIKLLLDFVPNHTSDAHAWFVKSLTRDPLYDDFYVWRDPRGFDDAGKPLPPNNWLSVFFGSAWTYREERQQFYLHQFDPRQPDLNYRNPSVVQEMKNVFEFWLDKGCDGFRVDAIPYLFEHADFLDEPPSNNSVQADDNESLRHIYTTNQVGTYQMVAEWRRLLDKYSVVDNVTRVMFTEAYTDIDSTMRYYGTAEAPGAHFTFNFMFIIDVDVNSTAQHVVDVINTWMSKMPAGGTPNWVIGNHDRSRVASRYGSELSIGLAMLVHVLPGVAVTYNGEEVGMRDAQVSWEDTQDPLGRRAGRERYQEFSRDAVRTPFQWDDSQNAGFSAASKTWLPVNENYLTLNLAAQQNASVSHYHIYQRLLEARQTETWQRGSLIARAVAKRVVAVARVLSGEATLLVVVNLGDVNEIVDLTAQFSSLPRELIVYTASLGANILRGDRVVSTCVPLRARSSLLLTTEPRN